MTAPSIRASAAVAGIVVVLWGVGSVEAGRVATKSACLAVCDPRIRECERECAEFGSSPAECRRDVLRICRRTGTSACDVTTTSTTLPPPESCSAVRPADGHPTCGGPCPSGMECAGFRATPTVVHCFCRPIAEWRIECGESGAFPTCDGPCPEGFQCQSFLATSGPDFTQQECLCVPDALARPQEH